MPLLIPNNLREAREARGYSTTQLAKALDVTRQTISQYENGDISPSAESFTRIISLLEMPIDFFTTERKRAPAELRKIFFRSLKRALGTDRNKLKIRLDWLSDILSLVDEFVELPSINLPKAFNYRLSDLTNTDLIEFHANELRRTWGLGMGPIDNIINLLESNGIIVSREQTDSDDLDALSEWNNGRPLIYLASDKNAAVRSRFDAAHELAHLFLHNKIDVTSDTIDEMEKQAHRFSGAFLLPRDSFSSEVVSTSLSFFTELKKRWKVSIQAMVYRCKDLDIISDNQYRYLWRQINKTKNKRRETYDDIMQPETPYVLPEAIKMIVNNQLLTRNEIAFRLKLLQQDIESLCCLPRGYLSPKVVNISIKKRK
ncbi:MAG: XRE family transcriptional regulator [Desulfarculaceae bacterium]|nr:XRE family transcriptional regulator [Desulfarculaceae bacterium]MCF8073914.1 XRE family transcriptional regulator [Desulfarculaceae bacterium]MCF8102067.1 XRE family transcriptional regulator [Desulfarculaceae bacterium]MCF8116338.1 XRE family transcriptional regulator [Desulfarculaceae bacterium]